MWLFIHSWDNNQPMLVNGAPDLYVIYASIQTYQESKRLLTAKRLLRRTAKQRDK